MDKEEEVDLEFDKGHRILSHEETHTSMKLHRLCGKLAFVVLPKRNQVQASLPLLLQLLEL